MVAIFKNRGNSMRKKFVLFIPIIAAILITGVVFAQDGALSIYTKPDEPTELIADGQTWTRLTMDLSGCAWYPGAGSKDLLEIQFTSNLGTTLSPPSVNGTVGEIGSPFEVVLKSGNQYGTAIITASASFCTEGNIMVFGSCSSQQEQNNPKCTGEFEIEIRPAGSGSEEAETEEESEETEELSVSLSCSSNPTVGSAVICTVSVSGAKQDESLEYIYTLDGKSGPKTRETSMPWVPDMSGYYDVSVEVFGQDRSVIKALRVEVSEPEAGTEEEPVNDASSSGSDQVSGLVSNLQLFLQSAGVKNISPARLAVAGTGVSILIAVWMITQHRSGVRMEKLEQALGRWREGEKAPKTLPESEKEPPKTLPEESSEEEDIFKGLHDDDVDPSKYCTACGEYRVAGVSDCPHCKEKYANVSKKTSEEGDIFKGLHDDDVDPSKYCTACGEYRIAGVSDCPHCKEKYANVSEKTSEVGDDYTNKLDPSKMCTMCGANRVPGVTCCRDCGEEYEKDPSEKLEPKTIGSLKNCPTCGNTFITGANFCHHCGSPQPKGG